MNLKGYLKNMKIYESDFETIARKCIAMYGNCEEHHYEHFLNFADKKKKPFFFDFSGYGVLAFKFKDGKTWQVMREILAPKEKRTKIMLDFADYVLNKLKAETLKIELVEDTREDLLKHLQEKKLRALKVNYYLDWPLFDIEKWDDNLHGGDFKNLRNIKNKFYREHKVEFVPHDELGKEELKRIVHDWRKNRKNSNQAKYHEYLHAIDSGFQGFDETRIMIVDGKVRAITAGWKVANSEQYYSSLGIIDYSIDRLSEIANLDDLSYLNSRGYKIVNFGGSEDKLLEFKKKFKPSSMYRTYIFSVKTEK